MIARGSLVEKDGGWTWAFDPYLWHRFNPDENPRVFGAPNCPVTIIWGERSILMPPERIARTRAMVRPETAMIGIPDAAHHVMIDQPLAFVTALQGVVQQVAVSGQLTARSFHSAGSSRFSAATLGASLMTMYG